MLYLYGISIYIIAYVYETQITMLYCYYKVCNDNIYQMIFVRFSEFVSIIVKKVFIPEKQTNSKSIFT